jgi:hypothetical protein
MSGISDYSKETPINVTVLSNSREHSGMNRIGLFT